MGCPCNGCDGHAAFVEEQRRQMAEKRERFEQWYAENKAASAEGVSSPEQYAEAITRADGTRYERQADGSLHPIAKGA